jgi:hypothetical protein
LESSIIELEIQGNLSKIWIKQLQFSFWQVSFQVGIQYNGFFLKFIRIYLLSSRLSWLSSAMFTIYRDFPYPVTLTEV